MSNHLFHNEFRIYCYFIKITDENEKEKQHFLIFKPFILTFRKGHNYPEMFTKLKNNIMHFILQVDLIELSKYLLFAFFFFCYFNFIN